MREVQSTISVLELKRLLIELKDSRPDIGIRIRLLGEMWMQNFMRIVHVAEKSVLLYNEFSNEFNTIPKLSDVMQFELDKKFQHYQPFDHYSVKPSPEYE